MNEVDTMATYEAKTAKKVYLYKNGSKHGQPKCMVINDRQIRDFSTFLNRVTSGIRAPVAVRNIYTPCGGHPVNKLDDLQSGNYYVAGGSEQFRKIKYGEDELKSPTKRQRNDFFVPHRPQQILVTTSRYNIPVEKPFVIHMFRNGDEKYRGARILLPRKIMGSWEHVLELITQKTDLVTPAKRICTLDGRAIHAVSEIQDGGKYVALEGSKCFQKVSYCATDEKKLQLTRSIPRAGIRLGRKTEHLAGSDGEGVLSDARNATIPFVSKRKRGRGTLKRRKSMRPMAGRKNKEGREKAIKDHREDSIFGGSPPLGRDLDESIRVAKMPSPPLKSSLTAADSDKEGHSDHFESSLEEPLHESLPALGQIQEMNENASETVGPKLEGDSTAAGNADSELLQPNTPPNSEGKEHVDGAFHANDTLEADTVPEAGETEVEKPIDQQEAEEVEEEDGTEPGAHPIRAQQAQDILLERQGTQTSVDLSLQRTSSKTTSSHTELPQNSRVPSKPSSRGPSKPSSQGPSKPSSREPSKPSSQGPSKASSRGPSKPSSRGPSKPSSQGSSKPSSKPPSRGPSKPPSRQSVASQSSNTNTKPSFEVVEVAQEAEEVPEETEEVEEAEEVPEEVIEEVTEHVEQVTEEVIPEEVEDTLQDSPPPTPPFSSPQEPEEHLEDQT